MTFILALIDSIMILLTFLAGLLCGMIYVEFPFSREECAAYFQTSLIQPQYLSWWFVLSLGFMLLSLAALYFRRKRCHVKISDEIVFITKKGNVIQISNKAITEYVFKLVKSMDAVHSASVRIAPLPKNRMFVKIFLSLWDGFSYPEVNDRLQDMIRNKVREDLGVDNISSITIILDKIVQTKTTSVPIEEEVNIKE